MTRGIYINWRAAGAQLAACDDRDMGEFFAGLCDEMLTWETSYARHVQLTAAAKRLTSQQREVLAALGHGETEG